MTLVGEVVLMGKRHPRQNWAAVGMMVKCSVLRLTGCVNHSLVWPQVTGALVAGMYDLSFDQTGYLLV